MEGETQKHFQSFVDAGHPIGSVTGVNSFLIHVKGLQPVNVRALVVFEDGSKGFVQSVLEDEVVVLHLGSSKLKIGLLVVVQNNALLAKVGKDFIGRVVSIIGEPLDGKGAIAADKSWPVFNAAPPIYQRELLTTQLETGITLIDALFPIARGQRMALLGDSKSGKSTIATQMAINQKNTDQVVVYVLIAKRRSDVDALITSLSSSNALNKAIVLVSTIFESLVTSYLAPYVGAAMAEYLWQEQGIDTTIIYDDLTTHAHVYREIALLSGASPGRDSYPGDMFHAHSSLLERAGRLSKSKKCLTAVPLVMADGGDITSYLPTNVMSITDGQWILDMDVFREGLRPAINAGLSVTRVGTVGHNDRQKTQNSRLTKALTAYEEAKQFAQFGSEMALGSRASIILGDRIRELLTQPPGETVPLAAQQLALGIILDTDPTYPLNVAKLKESAITAAASIKTEVDFTKADNELRLKFLPQSGQPKTPAPVSSPPEVKQ